MGKPPHVRDRSVRGDAFCVTSKRHSRDTTTSGFSPHRRKRATRKGEAGKEAGRPGRGWGWALRPCVRWRIHSLQLPWQKRYTNRQGKNLATQSNSHLLPQSFEVQTFKTAVLGLTSSRHWAGPLGAPRGSLSCLFQLLELCPLLPWARGPFLHRQSHSAASGFSTSPAPSVSDLPLERTPQMTVRGPWITSPSQDPSLDHICEVSLSSQAKFRDSKD